MKPIIESKCSQNTTIHMNFGLFIKKINVQKILLKVRISFFLFVCFLFHASMQLKFMQFKITEESNSRYSISMHAFLNDETFVLILLYSFFEESKLAKMIEYHPLRRINSE